MENKLSPADLERIKSDAERSIKEQGEVLPLNETYVEGYEEGYIAGATAVHERAQVLVDALELIERSLSDINDIVTNDIVSIVKTALQQWKGKEVEK